MVVQVTLDEKFKYGIKRTCRSCGVNFYDLDKHPSECPNCGALYELHVTARSRRLSDEVYEVADNSDDDIAPFDLDNENEGEIKESNIKIIEDDPFDLDESSSNKKD